ncbi:MAG: hypothetical protein DRN55_06320 [Thermoplasmata archaeon]|nr:MAG: hypothetical protein DRN55_06320 [Thermoplasmata archaeon]
MAAGGVRKAAFPPVFGMSGREGGGNEGNVVQNTSRRIRSKYIANNNNIMNIKNIKEEKNSLHIPPFPPTKRLAPPLVTPPHACCTPSFSITDIDNLGYPLLMIGYYPLRGNSGTAGWSEKRTKGSEREPLRSSPW